MKCLRYCYIFLLVGILSPCYGSTRWEDSLAKANAHFQDGKFQAAKTLYTKVQEAGWESATLYYNLGNAYYELGKMPEAIWAFEKTLLIAPSHDDAQYNLNMAKAKIADRVTPLPEVFVDRYFHQLILLTSPKNWTILSIVSSWLLALALGLMFWSKKGYWKRTGLGVGIFSLLFLLASLFFAWNGHNLLHKPNKAIVFEQNVSVKSAPDSSAQNLFIIHEGLKVKTLNRSKDWIEIELADGKKGWLPRPTIQPL